MKKTFVPSVKRMSAVGSAFDEMFFSEEDKKLAKKIRSQMNAGELSLPEAHTQMESIRARYNYSGGEDGSGYRAIPKQTKSYVSRYDAALQKATGDALNTEPFSYDAEQDPLYQKARKQYLAAGERAMDDTVARVSARTGGLASSYAAKAGEDVYLDYADKAEELLPQYEERAYRRYLQGNNDRRDAVELLRKLDAEEYERWQDAERAERQERESATERTYRYGKELADRAYREERDAADRDYRREQDESKAQSAAREAARKDVEAHLSAGGDWRQLPAEVLKNAGLSEVQMQQLAAAYQKKGTTAAKAALQQTIYKTGYRPTDEELAAAGMRREEADDWGKAYASNLPRTRSAGGSSRSRAEKETAKVQSPQYKNVVNLARNYNNLESMEEYLDRCVRDGYITEAEKRQIIIVEFGAEFNKPTADGRFDAVLEDLSFFLRHGDRRSAQSMLNRLEKEGMTEEEAERIGKILGQFGIKA